LFVVAVAASRVYLAVHYPSDVIAGLVLGTAWSSAVGWLVLGSATASMPGSRRPPPGA
jgi:undecaprenyl-diphosphatase